jgi:hypothetical protein
MLSGFSAFRGSVLLLLSGDDLTAREFIEHVSLSPEWRRLLDQPRVHRFDFPDADHTFSRREWKADVERHTCQWLRGLT